MYVLPGKDVGTVPAKAVSFKRVPIKTSLSSSAILHFVV